MSMLSAGYLASPVPTRKPPCSLASPDPTRKPLYPRVHLLPHVPPQLNKGIAGIDGVFTRDVSDIDWFLRPNATAFDLHDLTHRDIRVRAVDGNPRLQVSVSCGAVTTFACVFTCEARCVVL